MVQHLKTCVSPADQETLRTAALCPRYSAQQDPDMGAGYLNNLSRLVRGTECIDGRVQYSLYTSKDSCTGPETSIGIIRIPVRPTTPLIVDALNTLGGFDVVKSAELLERQQRLCLHGGGSQNGCLD